MKPARKISFWRYNLFLEVTTFGLAVFLLVIAVIFTLSEIRQRYLDRNVADAVQAALFLENYMSEAREVLSIFVNLREDERTRTVIDLMPAFSDLYRLDEALRVVRIYKAVSASQVFSGYSFTSGKLADYLREHGDAKTLSDMMRGYEDNRASVYLAIDLEGQRVLGRLDLGQVQEFLTSSARISGRPMLLVTREGFVMLSSDPELRVPVIDVSRWENLPRFGETLTIGARPWIPVLSEPMMVGSRVVTLVPTEPLETQRDLVDRIQTAGESLLSIINDILDISKIESGELSLDRRPFEIAALLTKLDQLYGRSRATSMAALASSRQRNRTYPASRSFRASRPKWQLSG